MPPRRAVELRVGGQTYRVVASDDDPQVQHLAELVDRKFSEVVPAHVVRSMTPHQAMFLTAMALASEVEELRGRADRLEDERDRSLRLATRAKDVVGRLLQRVDTALAPAPAPVRESAGSRDTASSRPAADPDDGADLLSSLPDDVRQSHPRMAASLDALADPSPDDDHEPLLIDLLDPPLFDPSAPLRPTASPAKRPAVSPPQHPAASAPQRPAVAPAQRPAASPPQRPAASAPQRPAVAAPQRPAASPLRPVPPELPAIASSRPFEQDNEATVPRAPRAGLRLVRRSTSDDDSR